MIIFDVDGTLRDTDDELVTAISRRLKPVARLLPGRDRDRAARRLVMRLETPANLMLGVPNVLGACRGVNRLAERLVHARPNARFRLVPGVAEMLQSLAGRYTLAVASSGLDRDTRQFLDVTGIATQFAAVATLGTCARTKPRPDPLRWVASELGVLLDECLMVGDTTVDIRAGRAAGAQTVGVLCGFGEKDELHRSGAHLVISSTADLAAHLTPDSRRSVQS